MLRTADENQDGKISFQEFAVAYHSKSWRRARLVGKCKATVQGPQPVCTYTPTACMYIHSHCLYVHTLPLPVYTL